ncbi:MAG: right-handed parallel beta-helix repeat-containing protein [Armatimonadota bacterium]
MRYLTILVLSLLLASLACAETYYVSPKGSDTNPGTEAAPFASIPKALTTVKEGDTVLVKAGTYPGKLTFSKSGKEQPTVLKAFGDGPVEIAGRIDRKQGFKLVEGKKYTYEIDETGEVASVTVDLDTTKIVMEGMQRKASVEEVEASVFSYFHDKQAGKLYLHYLNESVEPAHTVHVLRDGYGLHVPASNVVVEGLTVKGFADNGIIVTGNKNVTLNRCTVTYCGVPWGAGINLYKTEDARIVNCLLYRLMNGIFLTEAARTRIDHATIYRTRAHGVMLEKGRDNSIRNSILFAGGRSGAALYVGATAAAGLALDYNCYLDYDSANTICWMPLKAYCPTYWDYKAAVKDQDAHSISDDPLFVSTTQAKEDFHLQPNSPCKGKGEDKKDLGAEIR